jgi:hypothetical protein
MKNIGEVDAVGPLLRRLSSNALHNIYCHRSIGMACWKAHGFPPSDGIAGETFMPHDPSSDIDLVP